MLRVLPRGGMDSITPPDCEKGARGNNKNVRVRKFEKREVQNQKKSLTAREDLSSAFLSESFLSARNGDREGNSIIVNKMARGREKGIYKFVSFSAILPIGRRKVQDQKDLYVPTVREDLPLCCSLRESPPALTGGWGRAILKFSTRGREVKNPGKRLLSPERREKFKSAQDLQLPSPSRAGSREGSTPR